MYRLLRRIPLLFLFLLSAATGIAQAQHLEVLNPQQPWNRTQGTIEEATVTVRPHGVYMEYDLYLTFSARDGNFSQNEMLETALYFAMPEAAVFTDSWLWFKGDILRADIMDVWTASQIYEDIVNRNQDPSILYKRGPGWYELRIFPMAPNETRKVKLTYLLPAHWTPRTVTSALPVDLLRTSRNPVDLRLNVFTGTKWKGLDIVERPGIDFQLATDAELGSYLTTVIPWNDLRHTDLSLAFDAPLTDGVFFGETHYNGETWYQLALLPAEAIDVAAQRKVALLLDYDAGKTSVGEDELVETARSLLSTHLAPTDSFTVILSRLNIHRVSEDWLPADSATIATTFDALGSNPVADYSNLPALLADGIRFIKEQGTGGSLLLVSSSDQVGETRVANELIDDLRAETNPLPPLHLVDLANRNVTWYNIGGRSYFGNEYFYTNLARLSGGSFFSISDGTPYPQQLSAGFSALRGGIGSFDLYTTRENGFCYGRFPLGSATESVFLDRAILQVGKCFGSGAFTLETSGIYQSAPFSERLTLAHGAPTDSTLASLWTGRQIDQLERGSQNNDVISQIINYSLNQRVLSQYTAFIALEPSQGGEVCETCDGEPGDDGSGNPTDTEDEQPASGQTTLTAYPNPFNTQVTVKAKLAEPMNASEITVQIYNVMGQLVRTLHFSESGFIEELTLTWDGESDTGQRVASGTYFLVLTTPSGRHTLTLTLIR